MEMLILENGMMIEQMDMEFINKIMVLFMKGIGRMIYNMERVKRNVID